MLFLRSWLEDYIDLSNYSDEQLYTQISSKTAEVDEVITVQDYFGGKVVVGQILNVRAHPDADRLKIFDVLIGGGNAVQIVSAAPNVAEGLVVPVALDGATLPGLTIASRPLRGEKSEGMCCGKSELTLESGHSSGLWELESELPTGSNFQELLGQSVCSVFPDLFPTDTIFDISVLPNRIGVFGSYLGLALELSTVLGDHSLLTPKAQSLLSPAALFETVTSEEFLDSSAPAVAALELKDNAGITNSFSLFTINAGGQDMDALILRRMHLTGLHIQGNLSDISNYLLADVGQPNHFFNGDKFDLESDSLKWTISPAAEQRSFKGLGQLKKTTLPKGIPVIQDEQGTILAVPGISGGATTKMEQGSKILVEIASFYHEDIARSSFALKYRSSASKVFAGGVNQALMLVAIARLKDLLPNAKVALNGIWKNKQTYRNIGDFIGTIDPVTIEVPLAKLAGRLDSRPLEEWEDKLLRTLALIGSYMQPQSLLTRELFYSNLQDFEDVLEDVARLVGFEALRADYLQTSFKLPDSTKYDGWYFVKHLLSKHGFDEVILRPFVSSDQLLNPEDALELHKPQNATQPFVRDNLLHSLLSSLSGNLLAGYKQASLFELNRVYTSGDKGAAEHTKLGAIALSDDFHRFTSTVAALYRHIGQGELQTSKINDERGQGYAYHDESGITASLYQVTNALKKKYQIPLSKNVLFLSIDLSNWDGQYSYYRRYHDESLYPVVTRCYSFSLDPQISWAAIAKTIASIEVNNIRIDVEPLERLSGEDGQDTLTYTVDLVSSESTLSGEEISKFEESMQSALQTLGHITPR